MARARQTDTAVYTVCVCVGTSRVSGSRIFPSYKWCLMLIFIDITVNGVCERESEIFTFTVAVCVLKLEQLGLLSVRELSCLCADPRNPSTLLKKGPAVKH